MVFVVDRIVAFDLDEICVSPETWLRLKVTCSRSSVAGPALADSSSVVSFAFHLLTGETVTCEASPCHCVDINVTAVQLSCPYLPADYDRANLSCYFLDRPFVSVHAPVHVRGNACLAFC